MSTSRKFRTALLGASAMVGVALMASPASAQDARAYDFDMPAQPLTVALKTFGATADQQLIFSERLVENRIAPSLKGAYTPDQALAMLLAGSGLVADRTPSGVVTIRSEADPQDASAGGGAEVEALIVTAQKREEDIQDVPIAISAFSQEALERSQVAGGPDLITQVPNMTFTKTNFASYSIQIRGIGTQAISATTDAAVAVAFNNSSMIRNRFFEQEFYDLQRVEVLRGPQGTLYGRNATAGVVNIITAKPSFGYEAKISGDVANYGSTRLEGMVNFPLVDEVVALRVAGAWTKREGFVDNEISGNPIDGRDLWSTRVSLRFEPNERLSANLIWEHFEEDDDRLRSGKQVCKRDDRTELNGRAIPAGTGGKYANLFNQSCLPGSMYAEESYQAPNGFSLPYYHPLGQLFLPTVGGLDPYASTTQSRDLRVIESTVDPEYRAKADVGQLQIDFDLTDTLTLTSETVYSADSLFSMQDFNRFNTASGAFDDLDNRVVMDNILQPGPNGNIFCDPQIGCADRLVGMDLSTAKSRQFSQEFRIGSSYDGPFNFSVGANFLRYDTEDKYYVFINTLTLYSMIANDPLAQFWPNKIPPPYQVGVSDNLQCLANGPVYPNIDEAQGVTGCIYVDPNPISSLNDQGHNYFLSKNPYKLISYAAFGEAYYEINDQLKLTAGLRLTVDKKSAPRIPSWLLASHSLGYPVAEVVEQEWREPTGRLAVDWKPNRDTLLYASYAHGYKAGGANPPASGVVTYANPDVAQALVDQSATQPKTFAPEFVDAFEVGAKNTLLDGRLTLNTAAFFYDYEGYQISYIVNRSAVNLNFDAKIWGLELEADWRPTENLRFGLKGGYQKTEVADGMQAIDVMDRTAGDPNWVVVRPFPSFPSNCIVPLNTVARPGQPIQLNNNIFANGNPGPCEFAYLLRVDPRTGLEYVANPTVQDSGFGNLYPGYPGFNPDTAPNNGEGIYKQLGGNELPNAPEYTAALTADYTIPLPGDWLATLHGDLHYQSESWARIFNTEGYDKLKANYNVNLAAIFTNEEAGWRVMAYIKNVLDDDNITGAFLNSDDSGLTTNVFLNEPRLFGLRVTKEWSGDSWVSGLLGRRDHAPGTPYPFQVEIGGSVDRFESGNERFTAPFMEEYEPSLAFPADVQDAKLDTGDQREVKLTYAPGGGWRVSGAARYGRTNGSGRAAAYEQLPSATWNSPFLIIPPMIVEGPDNYGIATVSDGEEHTIVDFAVGKEMGLGVLGEGANSSVSLGIRYAQFKSRSAVSVLGTPDWYWPDLANSKYRRDTHTEYSSSLSSRRSFEGVGPALSWDAAKRLFGDDARGHVDLDWSISGGVLFGEQKVEAQGASQADFVDIPPVALAFERTTTLYNDPISVTRSDKVTVPTFSASMGLSYSVDRVKVSGGYRWERYFDAIDGGYEESKTFDRGFDGPYFKIAVGFGG